MSQKQQYALKTALIISDIIITFLSFFVAYFVRDNFFPMPHGEFPSVTVYMWALWVIVLFWPVVLNIFGVYEKTIKRGFKKRYITLLHLLPPVAIGVLSLTSVFFFLSRPEMSRLFIGIFAIVNLLMLWAQKRVIHYILRRRAKDKLLHRKVIVVTNTDNNFFPEYVRKNPHLHIEIVGFVCAGEIPLSATKNKLGKISDLIEILKNNVVDEVVFDLKNQRIDNFNELVNECEDMGVYISTMMYMFDFRIAKPDITMLGSIPLLTFKTTDFSPMQAVVKRLLDISAGIVGLLLMGIAFIFIAPAIKLESRGPILFGQNRVGRNGRVFKFYKFRSMYKDAEERKKQLMAQNEISSGHMFKLTDDPRITKVGKFIRKTSLDELPQFWNILMGDMSLVGTRPPTQDEVAKYDSKHWRRLSIKPGLTGMWQVSGRSEILDFDDVVKLDLEYIDNWSIWLDFKIILMTVLVVFKMSGSK